MTHTKSKVIKTAYDQWTCSHFSFLSEVYANYSVAKANAMEYCKRVMREYNGWAFRIIGYNCMTFSVGFLGDVEGKKAFFYITKDYDRFIFLDELFEG